MPAIICELPPRNCPQAMQAAAAGNPVWRQIRLRGSPVALVVAHASSAIARAGSPSRRRSSGWLMAAASRCCRADADGSAMNHREMENSEGDHGGRPEWQHRPTREPVLCVNCGRRLSDEAVMGEPLHHDGRYACGIGAPGMVAVRGLAILRYEESAPNGGTQLIA